MKFPMPPKSLILLLLIAILLIAGCGGQTEVNSTNLIAANFMR